MRGKTLPVHANFLEIGSYPTSAKSITVSATPPRKLNILLQEVIVLKFYGCRVNYATMVLTSKRPQSCVKTTMPSLSQKNPSFHNYTNHIDIRHHFICDHQEKGDIEINYVQTENQLADIFTKSLDSQRLNKLIMNLGMI